MNLSDALTLLAGWTLSKGLSLDPDALIAYAAEDKLGGRNAGYSGWSIDPDEGKLLYALVRALRPARVIEIGVHHGASTAHLLAALDANATGHLDSYDLTAQAVAARPNWTFHPGDALAADFPPAEVVFEDSAHGLDYSMKLFERLKFARVLVTHDYNLTAAFGDFHVKEAFDTVFPDGFALTLDGCERGLGVWINPDWQARTDSDVQLAEFRSNVAQGGATAATAKAPRSKAARKATARK